ncbi:DUF6054 family protein [Aminipila sp.]|uniref:DUF6054 family protein n=2 Tax=Aminipila sp. TaxID=2060095 RepID=UPI00289A18B7|nr:DUF6054 family protein [Aminipila sp.]
MSLDMRVNVEPEKAAELVKKEIVEGSITGELIDYYVVHGEDDKRCIVSIYEKHYYRAGNRLTITVVIDNMEDGTRVHSTSGGGGEGLFRFDWGASESFERCVENALENYKL